MTLKTEIHGNLAIAALDRETALNTLNLEMCGRLYDQLQEWFADPRVKAIVLRGSGQKAFCAGGDVKAICLELARGNEQYAIDFFIHEYRLDHAIHTAPKPIFVLAHGLVMGGGVGLLAGAAVRVVTTSTELAMPEIAIGLFPDVGASYFLQDAPGRLGLFAALTGARLNAGDALFGLLADVFIPDEKLDEFVASLEAKTPNDIDSARAFAANFSQPFAVQTPKAQWPERLPAINAALQGNDPHRSLERLFALGQTTSDPLTKRAIENLSRGSPTSAFLTFEQLRRGLPLSLESCFRMELDLAVQCSRRQDFREGVRALLIDKDRNPRWRPARIAEVDNSDVMSHFVSPWSFESHPLKDL